MKLNTETKVGIFAILAIAIFILGFNFMKNVSLFGKSFELKAYYDDARLLLTGNPVVLKGRRVGQVRSVTQVDSKGKIEVVFTLEKGLDIPVNSKAVIVGDLFNSQSIRIDLGNSKSIVSSGATLEGALEKTLQERVMEEILPLKENIDKLITQMESFVGWMNNTMDQSAGNKIDNILDDLMISAHNFSQATSSFTQTMDRVNEGLATANKILADLKNKDAFISRIMENTAIFTDSLAYSSTSVRSMIKETSDAIGNLQAILEKVERGDNSLGKLVNDTLLYSNINHTIYRVDSFLTTIEDEGLKLKHHIILGDPDRSRRRDKNK